VEFIPDDEPYESGKIESAGIEGITVGMINIHYCPKCNTVRDIEIGRGCSVDITPCEDNVVACAEFEE
jgi:hypothetical protein